LGGGSLQQKKSYSENAIFCACGKPEFKNTWGAVLGKKEAKLRRRYNLDHTPFSNKNAPQCRAFSELKGYRAELTLRRSYIPLAK
jgi:hypothetical protein